MVLVVLVVVVVVLVVVAVVVCGRVRLCAVVCGCCGCLRVDERRRFCQRNPTN